MSFLPLVSIITGNSNSGKACIDELFAKFSNKVRVRGVFRSEEKAQPFREKYPQLEIVAGVDANNLESLNAAFHGAYAACIVTPHDPKQGFSNDAQLTANMINKAVENGVKYIVYVGSFTCHNVEKMQIIGSRFKPSEELLVKLEKEKGIKWTSLRGGFFMENTLFMFKDSVKNMSTVFLPDLLYPMVDTRDIGKSAAACLGELNKIDQHHGKYYEMCGPEKMTGADVARIFSKVLNREIKHKALTLDDVKSKMPVYMVQLYEYMFESGLPFNDDVKMLTGQNSYFEQFLIDNKQNFS